MSKEKHNQVLTLNMLETQEQVKIQARLIMDLSKILVTQQNNINGLRDDQVHLTQAICGVIRGDIRVTCQCIIHQQQQDSSPNNIPTALEVV